MDRTGGDVSYQVGGRPVILCGGGAEDVDVDGLGTLERKGAGEVEVLAAERSGDHAGDDGKGQQQNEGADAAITGGMEGMCAGAEVNDETQVAIDAGAAHGQRQRAGRGNLRRLQREDLQPDNTWPKEPASVEAEARARPPDVLQPEEDEEDGERGDAREHGADVEHHHRARAPQPAPLAPAVLLLLLARHAARAAVEAGVDQLLDTEEEEREDLNQVDERGDE
eukprot:scaffold2131_cov113-Isochrysis_galbana.AAC.10